MVNKSRTAASIAALVLATAAAGPAAAAISPYTALALPTLTSNITTWSDGGAYAPLFPSSEQTFDGVPFKFASDAAGNNVFINGTLTIDVGQYGVTRAYAIVDSAFGSQGATIGSLTFHAAGGDRYTVDLVEGLNIRDHYYGSFVNTTSDPHLTQAVWGVNAPGHAHLDMLEIVLPSSFARDTLTSMTFESPGVAGGSPFLAAATVTTAPVPLPAAVWLLGSALGSLGCAAKRRG